jgi:hypothetical protein
MIILVNAVSQTHRYSRAIRSSGYCGVIQHPRNLRINSNTGEAKIAQTVLGITKVGLVSPTTNANGQADEQPYQANHKQRCLRASR